MLDISRGLMSKPSLQLLNEPSLGLAPALVQLILAIIEKINRENKTTIFLVEQNASMAFKIAHRNYVMENVVTMHDSTDKLLAKPGSRPPT